MYIRVISNSIINETVCVPWVSRTNLESEYYIVLDGRLKTRVPLNKKKIKIVSTERRKRDTNRNTCV